jgi:hypothetical protein
MWDRIRNDVFGKKSKPEVETTTYTIGDTLAAPLTGKFNDAFDVATLTNVWEQQQAAQMQAAIEAQKQQLAEQARQQGVMHAAQGVIPALGGGYQQKPRTKPAHGDIRQGPYGNQVYISGTGWIDTSFGNKTYAGVSPTTKPEVTVEVMNKPAFSVLGDGDLVREVFIYRNDGSKETLYVPEDFPPIEEFDIKMGVRKDIGGEIFEATAHHRPSGLKASAADQDIYKAVSVVRAVLNKIQVKLENANEI